MWARERKINLERNDVWGFHFHDRGLVVLVNLNLNTNKAAKQTYQNSQLSHIFGDNVYITLHHSMSRREGHVYASA